jgi:hypothetical protein
MHPAIIVAFTVGLSLAIALGMVAASHGILRLVSSGERPKPRLLVVACTWMIAVLAIHGYAIWRSSTRLAIHQRSQELALKAITEATQIAKSKGEDVTPRAGGLPTGPIFQAEIEKRRSGFEKNWVVVERLFMLLWLACGLAVGGYYCAVLRRSWSWPKALAVSLFFVFVQFFVIAVTTFVLSIWTAMALGGSY